MTATEAWLAEAVPHLEQYAGTYAMRMEALQSMVDQLAVMDLRAHIERQAAVRAANPRQPGAYRITSDGMAVVEVVGAMTKYGSSMSAMEFGTIGVRRAIRAALADDMVAGILLVIDSPGGTVAGTGDLADEVAKANAVKPVTAYIEDIGASAAYWVASQAGRIVANKTAGIGSIGVYSVIRDTSARAISEGVRVHVVKSGQFKGAGAPGTEVTAEHLAEVQREINEVNTEFVRAVADGRGLPVETAEALADGRLHIAAAAVGLGLIDAVGTIDDAAAGLRETLTSRAAANREPSTMANDDKPTAATLQELRDALPNATAEFREACQIDECTLAEAKDRYMAELDKRNAALAKQAETAKTEADEAKAKLAAAKKSATVEAIGTEGGKPNDGGGADPVAAWEQRVTDTQKAYNITRPQAVRKCAGMYPEAHREFVDAYNERYGRPALSR